MPERSAMKSRMDFPAFLNARDIKTGAEIGVDRAEFAVHLMRHWDCDRFYAIDNWVSYRDDFHGMPWDRGPDYMTAVIRLAEFGDRVRIIRADACDARDLIEPAQTFGFVYLDGRHTHKDTASDIAVWWPEVSRGGILAGHDYHRSFPGVMLAVDEFAEQEGLTLHVIDEQRSAPSWYVEKP